MLIESNQNAKYKRWMKLKQKKYRTQLNQFIVEGEHLVEEAILANAVCEVIIKDGNQDKFQQLTQPFETYYLKDNLFNAIASTEAPQPIMAICHIREQSLTNKSRLLLLDRVQDPGNLGTLIRSAVAFNFNGVILSEGCVDLYNEKVIRSTQGAIFKLPIEIKSLENEVKNLMAEGISVYGTSLQNGYPLQEIPSGEKMAFILGNEGSGVSQALLEQTKQNIFVEMSKNIESLNVSIAGSIIMHHFRQ
ncbi:MAG TPA: RNA methyltransferase [Firmicutes bacterium]|nr:RNA methyltransferase [Bacillota bacterium]